MIAELVLSLGIAAPEGWRAESFKFPLAFAPSIPYEGTEYVRFAPYWNDFAAERGFTYAILWDIKRRELQAAELERGLTVYFDALMENVTRGRKIEDPGTVSSVALHPMRAPAGWSQALSGRVWTWNAFAKGEPLVLHVELAHRTCGAERTQVIYLLSKSPRTGPSWDELRGIREKTACD